MAEYLIQDNTLTSLADKIRVLNGSKEEMTPAEMGSELDTFNEELTMVLEEQKALIEKMTENATKTYVAYTDQNIEDAYVMRTLTEATDLVTSIDNYAFYSCKSLTSVSFPEVTSIGNSAFYSCKSLTSANFPKVTSIGNNAFYGCTSLTSVNFPKVTSIGNNVFTYCSSLTSVNFPKVTSISDYAFYICKSLTSVSFPQVTSIGNYAFYSCTSLTSVNFSEVTSIGNYAFYSCTSLTSANFSEVTSIGSSAFEKCRTLSSLTLGASTVCTLENSNAFKSTPYVGYSSYFSGTPYIYVPSSLVASYKAATNWTYFSNYIVAKPLSISFDLDGYTYQAEEGMTWAEWIKSEYNIGEFYIDGDAITDGGGYITRADGLLVRSYDGINANGVYHFSW